MSSEKLSNSAFVERILSLNRDLPTEKVFVSTNYEEYAAGDTILYKAFVTRGEINQLSTADAIVYIELLDSDGHVHQKNILKTSNGTAISEIALPDTLATGKYVLKAYTNYMRNEKNYFYKSLKVNSVIPVFHRSDNKKTAIPDLQFLPEGGGLTAGVKTKVAFKCIGQDGRGQDVEGDIMDNENFVIAHFKSTHLGMGYFYLNPQPYKKYYALVKSDKKQAYKINLPDAGDSGIGLAVNISPNDKFEINIICNAKYFDKYEGKIHQLVIYTKSQAKTIPVTLDTPVIHLDLSKKSLRNGLCQLILLSPDGSVVSERRIFVNNIDRQHFKAEFESNIREKKFHLKFKADDWQGSGFSGIVKIAPFANDKLLAAQNNPNIMSYLLLTSDLKGTIEAPNDYFKGDSVSRWDDLDLVMLTHGYRKWIWQSLEKTFIRPAFKFEDKPSINGRLTDETGKALKSVQINLLNARLVTISSAITDQSGRFQIGYPDQTDSNAYFLQTERIVRTAKITLDVGSGDSDLDRAIGDVNAETNGPAMKDEKGNSDSPLNLKDTRALKEVTIKGSRQMLKMISYGVADQSLGSNRLKGNGPLVSKLMGVLHGVRFAYVSDLNTWVPVSNNSVDGPMKIVVGNQEMQRYFNLNTINAEDVESVSAFTNVTQGNGILLVKLKSETLSAGSKAANGILPLKLDPVIQTSVSYTPRYFSTEKNNRSFQKAYWNPNIQPDADGTFDLSFPAEPGLMYMVIIEGADQKGRICNISKVLYPVLTN